MKQAILDIASDLAATAIRGIIVGQLKWTLNPTTCITHTVIPNITTRTPHQTF